MAALLAYLLFSHVIPSLFLERSPALAGVRAASVQFAPILGLVFLLPMPFAYFNGRQKRRLVDVSNDLQIIRALSWREFEQLVAEAYRRKGYTVRENLRYGPDGGVDVTLEKDGQLHLVQCKQWKAQKVGVNVIREMFGVMTAQNATSVSVITSGCFTQEAKNFAEDKPIDLIDGAQLNQMISRVQRVGPVERQTEPPATAAQSEICPQCGSELVERMARRGANAGSRFLGCSGFPQCRYTRNTEKV
ncbi:MAG: restriction endonuclease [Congregibacter sp.]